MTYAIGSLVKARGRDWVVQPGGGDGWHLLKPLGGTDDEIVCVSPELEPIEPSVFSLPDPAQAGDARSCRLLHDAVRLGFRSACGPFRSFGRIAVEPRPYQLVPLLMAMKHRTVRLLIADDVGIGKTVEASLVVRELLDRGEVSRMAVICPPQLAEQWQDELESKFHIRADLVLPSTVSKLEKGLSIGTSLFEAHPFTIVSLDYIKSERHRAEFLRVCPECVIIDEAHSCAAASGGRGAKQRYDLVRSLSADPERHMVFVTATPHSGKDDVFRSLLAFLNPRFEELPEDLGGKENEAARRELAQHFVQRRRGDIASYMDASTPFPKRITGEVTWRFSEAEREYFRRALALARENLKLGEGESEYRRRIFWWSALALLRAVTSSPAAASATLQIRAIGLGEGADSGSGDPEALDDEARQAVYDLDFEDGVSVTDTLPGADAGEAFPDVPDGMRGSLRRKCRELAKEAEGLKGPARDSKLKGAVDIVRKLLAEGFSPIVFCRFIDTAEYVADALRQEFKRVAVAAVTGVLPPEERENRVLQLAKEPKRILVCTDCLSEGVNLQESFSAVVHYDLSWNPTRHEQREGRVDRYGQPLPEVKVVTYWGEDNPVDGRVLEVLLRKHESIRRDLGVSVPVPEDSGKVMHAILQGLLLHGSEASAPKKKALMLPGMEEFLAPENKRLEEEWDRLAEREQKRSRTVFAQQSVKVEEVARELQASSDAAGDAASAERFLAEAIPLLGGTDEPGRAQAGRIRRHVFAMDAHARGKHPGLEMPERIAAAFEAPVQQGEELLSRTHPLVEGIAGYVMDTALDPELQSPASRSGVMYTSAVSRRTTLLLCRFRFQLETKGAGMDHSDLAEDCVLLAFAGAPDKAAWLSAEEAEALLKAEPCRNVDPGARTVFLTRVNEGIEHILPHVREAMRQRADAFLDAHRRVRDAAKLKGARIAVQPQGEPDILGAYVYLPA